MGKKMGLNLWIGMWRHPLKTLRSIIKTNPRHSLFLLYWIYGFSMSCFVGQLLYPVGPYPVQSVAFWEIVLLSIPLGFVGLNVLAALFCWTGKWLGGRGGFVNIRSGVGWIHTWNLVAIFLLVIGVITDPFIENEAFLVFIVNVVQMVTEVGIFILMVRFLAEIHCFSILRALFNFLIAVALFVVMIAVLSCLGWSVSCLIGRSCC
jgi:hypothetical protein